MTAKEYLLRIKQWDKSLKRKLEKLEKLKSRSTSTTVVLGNEGGTGVHKQDTMEDAIIGYIELERELRNDMDELNQFKLQVSEQLDQLDDAQEAETLFHRYIELMQWKQVAKVMGVSLRSCYTLNDSGLENLEIINRP